jgi:hypothetical protein
MYRILTLNPVHNGQKFLPAYQKMERGCREKGRMASFWLAGYIFSGPGKAGSWQLYPVQG